VTSDFIRIVHSYEVTREQPSGCYR